MSAYSGIGSALEGAAKQWPDRLAFRFRDDVLTYQSLWDQACSLAAELVAAGVAPGDRVAIAMTKGLEMPVAIHAIWMAGAVFVPFDTGSPVARLSDIADDCGIQVVITANRNRKLAASLEDAHNLTVLMHSPGNAPKEFQPRPNADGDLAYIIFTSGSTGIPKGICHTHASGRAFAKAWRETYDLTSEDVFFSTVPLHFDFSLADFFTPAEVGACVELVPEMILSFPASVADLLESSGATIWSSVPFTFTQLGERGATEGKDLSSLRWVIYGGEPMPPSALPLLRQTFAAAQISNSYGPAEVNQTTEFTVPADHASDRAIPIGRPIGQFELALDETGELLVAGPSMMQGYWNRPELNSKAFTEINGTRFYKTGDRVSKGADGIWTFNGREDRLVKIRGHRVELDEIELTLNAHTDVSEAAVIKSADGLELNAFVTLTPAAKADEATLRNHLSTYLPGYAVPSRIEIKQTLKKTSTGKINRNALSKETAQ